MRNYKVIFAPEDFLTNHKGVISCLNIQADDEMSAAHQTHEMMLEENKRGLVLNIEESNEAFKVSELEQAIESDKSDIENVFKNFDIEKVQKYNEDYAEVSLNKDYLN